MMARPIILPLLLFLLCFPCFLSGQSLSVGDEVVYSGGPSQPPQSKQTGLRLQAKIVSMTGVGTSKVTTGLSRKSKVPSKKRQLPSLDGMSSEQVRERLGDSNPQIRALACRVFAKDSTLPRAERIGELQRSLWDDEAQVVEAAALSLAHLNARELRGDLEELLGLDEDRLVLTGIRALGILGDAKSRPALQAIVDGADPRFETAAKKALEKLVPPTGSR